MLLDVAIAGALQGLFWVGVWYLVFRWRAKRAKIAELRQMKIRRERNQPWAQNKIYQAYPELF